MLCLLNAGYAALRAACAARARCLPIMWHAGNNMIGCIFIFFILKTKAPAMMPMML